jgi:hypothetical protein
MKLTIVSSILCFGLCVGPSAFAQQPDPNAPAAAPAPPAASSAPAAEAPPDGGRFRFGINPTIGMETVSASGASLSALMYGLDMRLGYQINNLLAVYAQPHLSFGSFDTKGAIPVAGFTGTFVGTVMAEATFIDRLFVGGGLGYGVFNNPSGLAIEGRFGGYPLMGKSSTGPRRKGLMIGGDIRAVFLDGATGTMFMGCLGYEAF